MSTTFEVYPGRPDIPTFGALLETANQNLAAALNRNGVKHRTTLQVELRQCQSNVVVPTPLTAPARWAEDTYAWFFVPGITGGSDAHFSHADDLNRQAWDESLRLDANVAARRDLVRPRLAAGYYWNFTRWGGTPAIINLAYGLVAAALAELTDGFIHSYDNAWEFTRFPATADEFLSWYFVPEETEDADFRSWAEACLRDIPVELSGGADGATQEGR